MEHMLFVTLQSRYMKSDTGHKRKAPHVDFVLIKIQDFVVFLVFFQRISCAESRDLLYYACGGVHARCKEDAGA